MKWPEPDSDYSILFNTLRPRQNGHHFADDTFKYILLNENVIISAKISLKFVPKGSINNIPTLVQMMDWRRPGDKPLSEPMMVRLSTHICVTRPRWVNIWYAHGIVVYFFFQWWYYQFQISPVFFVITHVLVNKYYINYFKPGIWLPGGNVTSHPESTLQHPSQLTYILTSIIPVNPWSSTMWLTDLYETITTSVQTVWLFIAMYYMHILVITVKTH